MKGQWTHRGGTSTYTYDNFAVFFHGDRIWIGGKEYPVGQCTVDIMNVDTSVLNKIEDLILDIIPAALTLLTEKTDRAAALAQERLNAVWDIMFTLPVYRDLPLDREGCYHAFPMLMADEEKWMALQDPTSKCYAKYQAKLRGLAFFIRDLRELRGQIAGMSQGHFGLSEPDKGNPPSMVRTRFYSDALSQSARNFVEISQQCCHPEADYIDMPHPTQVGETIAAERLIFTNLVDFLREDFYRGLTFNRTPRKCCNPACGKFFLHTGGKSIRYCDNIAPGETERTCRMVAAQSE